MSGLTDVASSGMVNVNYSIPEELHRALKVLAATQGVTLKALITRLLTEAVDREQKGGKR